MNGARRRMTRGLASALGAALLALALWATRARFTEHDVAPQVSAAPTSSAAGPQSAASAREHEGQGAAATDRSPPASPAAPIERETHDTEPTPALRAAFERETPDATAPVEEARLRAIYGAERDAGAILRDVRCTRSVCKLGLRWSPQLHEPYNKALVRVIHELSRDIDLHPEITPGEHTMPIPMTLYVARPGYSVEGLFAEQAKLAR